MNAIIRTSASSAANGLLVTAFLLLTACGGGGGGGDGNANPNPNTAARGGGANAAPPPGEEFYAAPEKVTDTLLFTQIAAGYHHTCAIAVGGDTYCWGYNEFGQLGSSMPMQTCVSGMFACSPTPVRVDGSEKFTSLAASIRHTCGLTAAGDAYCWGFGLGGQLGDGARSNSVAPVAVAGGLKFTALAASIASGSTCGLTAAGDAWCWGINVKGELGNGTQTALNATPAPLVTALKFTSISFGQYHACAVDTARNAVCWGDNWFGQLGVGSAGGRGGYMGSVAPVAVQGGLKLDQIVAAGMHTCALASDGAAHCWGVGNLLGIPPTGAYEALPLPVAPAGSGWAALSRGFGQTCALTAGGDLYCWGHRVALPNVTAETPVRIGSNQAFVAFSAGGTHICAIGADGFAYCFGTNSWGQIGRPPSDP